MSEPSTATLVYFARATLDILTSWPALRFACAQQWPAGSRKAQEGRQVCCEQIVDLFYDAAATSSSSAAANAGANGVSGTGEPSSSTAGLPAQDTLEDLLVGCSRDLFNLELEDDSERFIARDMLLLWQEACSKKEGDEAGELAKRFEVLAGKAKMQDGDPTYWAQQRQQQQQGDDDDDSSSGEDDESEQGDDEDVEMALDEPQPPQKEEPQVDDDGFQTVTKSSRRHR